MANAFDDDLRTLDVKLQAIVAGSESEVSGQIALQRLCPTDRRPLLQPFDQLKHPRLDRLGQPIELPACFGVNVTFIVQCILRDYDKLVNPGSFRKSIFRPKN
jgi:hypothetical protein